MGYQKYGKGRGRRDGAGQRGRICTAAEMKAVRRIIILCLFAALMVTGGCSDREKERQELRLQGIEQLDAGNYEAAIEAFEGALSLSSKVVGEFELDILKYRAEAEYKAGDYGAAAYTYGVLMQVDQERNEYRTRICRLQILAGQLDDAVEEYKKLYEAAPKDGETTQILLSLGQALTDQDRADQAIELYQQAVNDGMENGEIYNRMAVCQLEAGDLDLAIQYLEQGVETGDQSVMASLFLNQAAAYERKLDFQKALSILQQYAAAYGADEEIQKEIDFLKSR